MCNRRKSRAVCPCLKPLEKAHRPSDLFRVSFSPDAKVAVVCPWLCRSPSQEERCICQTPSESMLPSTDQPCFAGREEQSDTGNRDAVMNLLFTARSLKVPDSPIHHVSVPLCSLLGVEEKRGYACLSLAQTHSFPAVFITVRSLGQDPSRVFFHGTEVCPKCIFFLVQT